MFFFFQFFFWKNNNFFLLKKIAKKNLKPNFDKKKSKNQIVTTQLVTTPSVTNVKLKLWENWN